MIKAFLCSIVSLIAGSAIAVILALGIASVGAAIAKTERGTDTLVSDRVVALKTPIGVAAAVGFVVGAGAIVWMFYGRKWPEQGPEEPGESTRSEV